MNKFLLTFCATLVAIFSMPAYAQDPTPTPTEVKKFYFLTKANPAPSDANVLNATDRTELDIEDGVFKYLNTDITISGEEGTFTLVSEDKSVTLGGYADMPSTLSLSTKMVFLAPDGAPCPYSLPEGSYNLSLKYFAEEGFAAIELKPNFATDDQSYFYFTGINGEEEATGNYIFPMEPNEDGMYVYPRLNLQTCPKGMLIRNSASETFYGAGLSFTGEISTLSDDTPAAILAENGEALKSTLTPGIYSASLMVGALNMIVFNRCEDQTPLNESELYIVGINGMDSPSDACKLTRTVIGEGDDKLINYSLSNVKIDSFSEKGIVVANKDLTYSLGVNPVMGAMLGGGVLTDAMSMGIMSLNGKPFTSKMTPGTYDITVSPTGDSSALLSITVSEGSAAEGVETDNTTPVYYNLTGSRVENPSKGLFIVKKGNKTEKVFIK